jgi:hypothetical protein
MTSQRLPLRPLALAGTILSTALLSASGYAQGEPAWYRAEIIVFASRAPQAGTAETWEATPALNYPLDHRRLLAPEQLTQRVAHYQQLGSAPETGGELTQQSTASVVTAELGSTIALPEPEGFYPQGFDVIGDFDERGLQRITLNGRVTIDTLEPEFPLDPNTPLPDPNQPEASLTSEDDAEAPAMPTAFLPLPSAQLELGEEAVKMTRSGRYRVLLHTSWSQPLQARASSLPLVLDNSGDGGDWPELQGSIRLYLSRYLHLETNLWLNTSGDYLPPYWRMPAAPRGPSSLHLVETEAALAARQAYELEQAAATETDHDETQFNPAEPPLADLFDADITAENTGLSTDSGNPIAESEQPETSYPYRHAVLLQQKRRMRGGEIHYIDHPMFGVVIKLTALDEEALAAQAAQEQAAAQIDDAPQL